MSEQIHELLLGIIAFNLQSYFAVFHVEEVPVLVNSTMLTPIQEEDAKIIIPIGEVLAGFESEEEVRVVALLFRNMSGLLPERIDYEVR